MDSRKNSRKNSTRDRASAIGSKPPEDYCLKKECNCSNCKVCKLKNPDLKYVVSAVNDDNGGDVYVCRFPPNKESTAYDLFEEFNEMLRNLTGNYLYNTNTSEKACNESKVYVDQWEKGLFTYNKKTMTCTFLFENVDHGVVGHELGHAIIKVTSNLKTKYHAGAVHESFADLCGVAFKASQKNWTLQDNDWQMSNGPGTRYMNDPPKDNCSIDCLEDYDRATDCSKRRSQDRYYTNGIFNKGIYNLWNTTNWNIREIFKLFLRTTLIYWNRNETMEEALCDLLECVKDYDDDAEVLKRKKKDIKHAFSKVGVFGACSSRKHFVPRRKKTWENASDICETKRGYLIQLECKQLVPFNLPEGYYWINDITNNCTACSVRDLPETNHTVGEHNRDKKGNNSNMAEKQISCRNPNPSEKNRSICMRGCAPKKHSTSSGHNLNG